MTVAIVGVGTTGYRRRQDRRLAHLLADAARRAVADAGVDAADVDGLIVEGAILPGQISIDLIAQAIGISPRFVAHGAVGGAGLVGSPALAAAAIAAGDANVVLVVNGAGGELDADPYRYHATDPWKASLELPMGWYGQAIYFAAMAQRYAHEYGRVEDALAEIAIEARRAAARTPGASRTDHLDLTSYEQSPMVAEPLRAADCCLISEGASAFVLSSIERARHLPHPPAVVAGCALASDDATQATWFTQRTSLLRTAAARSGPRALARAGLSITDIDSVQLYDCFTITPLLQLEDLGMCDPGGAVELVKSGKLRLGGATPMNTHGGLLAYGFCLGISHLIEGVHQIRGDRGQGQVVGAETVLVGGLGVPFHATTILTADR